MLKQAIPNFLTFSNLTFGILSIYEIFENNFLKGAIFILVAAFIDRYDGRVARLFNVSSEIGKELDSLSDLVSFGVAPGFLAFYKYGFVSISNIKAIGIICLVVYIICGAYRLAKYNISNFNGVYTGIPITVAGSFLAVYSLVVPCNNISKLSAVFLIMVLSYLMISKFKIKKI